jgi:hypothetical protein
MAIVVVGGAARGVGKTALVCGLIAALPEFAWTAVKITSHGHEGHGHGRHEPIWEEAEAGQGTDTARYLAAGARRAFLLTARDEELSQRLAEFWNTLDPGAHVLFESNRILAYVKPDLCIAIDAGPGAAMKSSFRLVERQKNATVRLARKDSVEQIPESGDADAVFQLAGFEHISPPMRQWLLAHLNGRS